MVKKATSSFCSIDGCTKGIFCKGLCRSHYQKQYNETLKGKESKRKSQAKYKQREGIKEKTREYQREYEQSESGKAAKERYLKSTKGKEKQQRGNKKYLQSEKGKEKNRKSSHRRRAKQYGLETENFSSKEIFERDEWKCGLCGEPVNKRLKFPDPKSPSLDHIKPLSKGGTHTRDNVQLAHLRCNLVKGDKVI